jgi:RNA polymerase sigma-70 factor, ECF subfamily
MGPFPLEVLEGGRSADAREELHDLYKRYAGAVFGRCLYLLKDAARAEDALQDVFARALRNQQGFRNEASPLTWLMKIATHHCLNELRAERAGWRHLFERDARAAGEGSTAHQVMELREQLRTLLSRFDPETQAAAIHYHVDEMTLEEVARLLGRSVPTIRKRLQHFAKISGQELRA